MTEDEDDDSGEVIQGYWEKVRGFISENEIDVRWILRMPNDPRAYGSLRIVSHPDLKPGYLRAFSSIVVSRKPKTEEEIKNTIDQYQMDIPELEIYTLTEHIETYDTTYEDRYQELEKLFNVKIFK